MRPVLPFPVDQAPAHAAHPPNYPAELEQWLTLRNSQRFFVRPLIPADELALEDAWSQVDTDTLYQRFFVLEPKLDARRLHALVHMDYRWRLALVAFAADGQGTGIARYESAPGQQQAEIALVVHPAWRRLGLGRRLLALLTAAAQTRGIQHFTAIYLEGNLAMAALLDQAGFSTPQVSDGVAITEKTL